MEPMTLAQMEEYNLLREGMRVKCIVSEGCAVKTGEIFTILNCYSGWRRYKTLHIQKSSNNELIPVSHINASVFRIISEDFPTVEELLG